jgi:phage-related protein (TIGR01555 family)
MKNQTRSKKSLRPNDRVVTAAPTADSFQNFQARIGYGTGNVADGGTYNVDYLSRNRYRVEAMYRSSWICGKAVDCIAEDMTKRGIELNSEMDPEQSEKLLVSWKRMRVWDHLCDTIKWARLYGGSIAVMLIDGQALETPLRIETIAKDQFKGLAVYDRWMVTPSLSDLITDLGPQMGLPKFYQIMPGGKNIALGSTQVHYSRVIRFEGQDLPYFQRQSEQLWGQSVLERLFDRLMAFDSTTQGAAQLVYKAHLRTYKVEGLRDIIAMGGKALEGLVKQIDFIRATQTNEGMTLMDSKDEFEAHAYNFGGLDVVLLQFAQQLSGALSIPLTRLFGQSPAGMNSTGEGDLVTYYDGIEQEQERRLRSGLSTLLQISYRSLFGKNLPEASDFTFRPLWQMSDKEKSEIAGGVATAIGSLFTSAIIGRQTALKELRQSSRVTGIFTNITDEAIEAADDDVTPGGEFGMDEGLESDNDEKDEDQKPSLVPKAA